MDSAESSPAREHGAGATKALKLKFGVRIEENHANIALLEEFSFTTKFTHFTIERSTCLSPYPTYFNFLLNEANALEPRRPTGPHLSSLRWASGGTTSQIESRYSS